MKQAEKLKTTIRESYGAIARREEANGCCDNTACCAPEIATEGMAVDYAGQEGYVPEADLSLGCGIPTEIAAIQPGHTVLDLGAGAGNDVFIARRLVGESGRVIGLDMTPEMVIRAWQNNQKLGYNNVEFVLGEIEDMTHIPSAEVDVVISNCVMNLVPNKEKAFAEMYRVLKKGGHFSISDIVYTGYLPDNILEAAEMYAGCISGSGEKGTYLGIIKDAGFKHIQIKKERRIELPESLLAQHLNPEELKAYKQSEAGIYSITVFAEKLEEGDCCESNESDCCGSTESAGGCC
ncbi:MAG: arsenite methyltransferase [Bacteroidota bacterium]